MRGEGGNWSERELVDPIRTLLLHWARWEPGDGGAMGCRSHGVEEPWDGEAMGWRSHGMVWPWGGGAL